MGVWIRIRNKSFRILNTECLCTQINLREGTVGTSDEICRRALGVRTVFFPLLPIGITDISSTKHVKNNLNIFSFLRDSN